MGPHRISIVTPYVTGYVGLCSFDFASTRVTYAGATKNSIEHRGKEQRAYETTKPDGVFEQESR